MLAREAWGQMATAANHSGTTDIRRARHQLPRVRATEARATRPWSGTEQSTARAPAEETRTELLRREVSRRLVSGLQPYAEGRACAEGRPPLAWWSEPCARAVNVGGLSLPGNGSGVVPRRLGRAGSGTRRFEVRRSDAPPPSSRSSHLRDLLFATGRLRLGNRVVLRVPEDLMLNRRRRSRQLRRRRLRRATEAASTQAA